MKDPADRISAQSASSEHDLRARFIQSRLGAVYGLVCALTGNPEEAQELTQEAMIKVLQRHSGPRDLDNAADRLRGVAIALAMDYLRRVSDASENSAAAAHFVNCYVPVLGPHMDALSVPERVAFLLRDVEGLSSTEVARYMGCSQREMQSFLAKARLTVQELSASERGQ